jgi:tetratricopeptide (TPR) repeat protein
VIFPVEAKRAIDPIVDRAIKHDYKKRVSQINVILGVYYHCVNEDFSKALAYFEKALKIGEELNDYITLVLANNFMGTCLSDNGEFEKALYCLKKALEINVMANVPWGIVALKAVITSWVYFRQGEVELASQASQEALRIAGESGDIYSRGLAHFAQGFSYYLNGHLEQAQEQLIKSLDLLERSNQLAFAAGSNTYLSKIYFNMGMYEKSQKHCERAISLWQQCSLYPSYIIVNKMFIVLAKVMNKEKDINLYEVYKWYEDIKSKWAEGVMSNCIGKVLLTIDDQNFIEAEKWIIKAIETNQKYGMMWNLGQDYALYAELYKRKEEPSKTREKLNKAIEIFAACGADGWVERYEKELIRSGFKPPSNTQ